MTPSGRKCEAPELAPALRFRAGHMVFYAEQREGRVAPLYDRYYQIANSRLIKGERRRDRETHLPKCIRQDELLVIDPNDAPTD